MTISLAPPPLQVPGDFATDKVKNAFFSGLLNTIYQLWTSVYSIRLQADIETTDATVTGLVRVDVPAGKTVMVQARVVARRTGGTSGTEGDSAFYVATGAYKNVGGVLTGIGTPQLYGGEDQAGWEVSFSSSGQFLVVTVKGAANNVVKWEGTISSYTVGA